MPTDPMRRMIEETTATSSVTSELLYEALDAVPTAVYIKNRNHRLLFVNDACCELLGRSRPELFNVAEAEILSAATGQSLQHQDEDVWQGQLATASTEIVAAPTSAHTNGQLLTRRTQLAAGGQALLCFLAVALPTPPLAASVATPSLWQMPQLQALLANVPAVIYQLCRQPDGQVQFTFVSPGAHEIFGVASRAILVNAEQILRLLHPLDRPTFEHSLAASATTLTPWHWEGRYYQPDGKVGWIQTAARPQPLPRGAVVWDGSIMDVTSRKQVAAATIEQAVMAQALADNETRFRTLTETIPGAIMQLRVHDRGYVIDFVSDRIEAITGLTPALLTTDAHAWFEQMHPVDHQRLQETLETAVTTASAWHFEGRLTTPSGETRWWCIDALPGPPAGEDLVFCGVVLDVTDRKTIEEAYQEHDRQLRMALQVSGMGVWTWDMATDQMAWTTEPGTLFEVSAVSFCDTFDAYLQNVHPSDRDLVKAAVSQAVKDGQDYQIEYRLLLGDDTVLWIGERGGVWRNLDGMLLGLMGTVLDITDRMTASAALKESEERNRTLINNIPGAVYRCKADKDWTLIFQSDAIFDVTGYAIDHPIHHEDWRLIHPDDRDRVDHDTTAAIAQRQPFEVEYRLLHADGGIRWVLETGQPITDATGTVQLIDGVLTDITRRKQSETRLQDLASREGLINRISTQIRESLELQPILQTTVQTVRQQLATDRVVVYRFRPDWTGEVIVEDVASPWRSTLGEIGTDNCFPSGLAQYYEAGQGRAIDDIYQTGFDACHIQYLETLQVRANLIVPILLKKQLWGLLIAHECRGPRHWTDSEIELLAALAGQVGLAIGQADLFQQATENATRARQQAADLKATLAELQRTQAKLVQTEKMSSLGQLVAGVAHEINNPVSFIDGNILHAADYAQDLLKLTEQYQATYPHPPEALAQLIAEVDLEFLAADFPKLLDSMRVGAERIKTIVASLRNFSRMDEAEIKAVNIHEGLDSTLMILQHRLKADGDRPQITLTRRYDELPLVECYAGKLNQVFMNLISNAIDAIEEQMATGNPMQPPTITLTTEALSPDQIRISISDTGSGIAEAKRQRIFEPFYTTKPIGKGTGIGLSISYQIVTEHHHGTLACESQAGQGTTFHVTIPVQQGTT